MLRRFILFGFGIFLGIFFLSFGPNNRLKETFYSYVKYFNINSRVIFHLNKGDKILISSKANCQIEYYQLNKKDLLVDLQGCKVNFKLSDKKSKPCKTYVIEKNIKNKLLFLRFSFCDLKNKVTLLSCWYQNTHELCAN